MDVNQVRFGNYSIGQSGARQAKKEEKPEQKAAAETKDDGVKSTLGAEKMLGAMEAQGLANLAQVNFAAKKEINPADYLSNDRIADIEAMMGEFDSGVNKIADALKDEFPMLSPDNRLAFAAHIFAAE